MRKLFSTERAIKAHRHKIIEKLRVLANGGTANDYTVVSEESLRLASGPTNEKRYVDLRLNHPTRWGLGSILGPTPDIYGSSDRPHLIGHAGGGANVAWGDPKTGIAVAFLCNPDRLIQIKNGLSRKSYVVCTPSKHLPVEMLFRGRVPAS